MANVTVLTSDRVMKYMVSVAEDKPIKDENGTWKRVNMVEARKRMRRMTKSQFNGGLATLSKYGLYWRTESPEWGYVRVA